MKIAAGLTIALGTWYYMADHSGPFYFPGLLLNEHGDAVKSAEVSYEYMLASEQSARSQSVTVNSGFFLINVPETDIIYVKLTGIWVKAASASAKNILLSMSVSEETALLFKPASFFKKDKRHWSPRETYVFQEGMPVKTEIPVRFEE